MLSTNTKSCNRQKITKPKEAAKPDVYQCDNDMSSDRQRIKNMGADLVRLIHRKSLRILFHNQKADKLGLFIGPIVHGIYKLFKCERKIFYRKKCKNLKKKMINSRDEQSRDPILC